GGWIVARRPVGRKFEQFLENRRVEAARRQPPQRLDAAAAAAEELACPLGLRSEAPESRRDHRRLEPVALEPVADRRVAVAPHRERRGPGAGRPLVVDEPGALERVQSLGPGGRGRACTRQPCVEAPPRVVTVPERAGCPCERLGPSELATE